MVVTTIVAILPRWGPKTAGQGYGGSDEPTVNVGPRGNFVVGAAKTVRAERRRVT